MQSRTTRRFWRLFSDLPVDAQREAQRAYRLFQSNPAHPGLQFKKLEGEDDIYSARIGLEYRALAIVKKDRIVWYGSAITPNTTVWSDPLANCAHPIQCASHAPLPGRASMLHSPLFQTPPPNPNCAAN